MICYRFDNQTQWRTLALANGLARIIDGTFTLISDHNIAIDDVGIIPNNDGVFAPNGDVITPPTMKPGYHVNIIHPSPPEALDPHLVVVSTAYRMFLGGTAQAPDDATLDILAAL